MGVHNWLFVKGCCGARNWVVAALCCLPAGVYWRSIYVVRAAPRASARARGCGRQLHVVVVQCRHPVQRFRGCRYLASSLGRRGRRVEDMARK